MKKEKILNKLKQEHSKLLNQLENSETPLITEVIISSTNRIKALDYFISLIESGQTEFSGEREVLLSHLKGRSIKGLPVDMFQVVNRLQVINYINKLINLEDKDDTSN